ncbi:hypothetical protein ACF08N_08250 [Streptomyces sp. NPDC015127]|uniref:hypothetical protein n=1 Tax=Streptomyces sp. NPDC015127 TaxID=3364939 RepID=UPI0036FFC20D
MISEPELVGEDPFDAPTSAGPGPAPGTVAESVTDDAGTPADPRGTRRRWLWALGGAAAASALWAGGLFAFGGQDPDLGGYRATENLCEAAELKNLQSALGKREGEGMPSGIAHATRAEAQCSADLRPTGYQPHVDEDGNEMISLPGVFVTYTLHKKTDPGPEFDGAVLARQNAWDAEAESETVVGIGEQAHIARSDDGSTIMLEVLDGQAEIGITVTGDWDPKSGEPATDVSELEGLLVQDMQALMARLRS